MTFVPASSHEKRLSRFNFVRGYGVDPLRFDERQGGGFP